MAEHISIECRQCSTLVVWDWQEFVGFITEQQNTRVNLKDSGSLNLSLFICDDCDD